MDWRDFIDAGIVMACGVVLLSPEFNSFFSIPIVSLIEHIPTDVISHLAIGLVPLILIYLVRSKWTQILVLTFAMVLMLSKHYVSLHSMFSFFYEGKLAVVSVVVGGFAVLHGMFVMLKSVTKEI